MCFLESFKLYQLFNGEERRIPFIFDDFHFCRSRVIELDMTENRIVTLCRMITWVVFLRMFWNFISSLPVKRGGSLSFLMIFTFAVPELCLPFERRETYYFSLIFFFRFCFFSAKLVRTITFLSFQIIRQLYLVCGCMTIRWCVAYRNDLHVNLIFDLKVK